MADQTPTSVCSAASCRRGSAVIALCSTLVGASVTGVVAGAGANAPEKTIPTLPPSSGDVATTEPPPSSAAETTEPATIHRTGRDRHLGARPGPPSGTVRRGQRGLRRQRRRRASGLGRFAVIPAGIPTPAEASIDSFSIVYHADPGVLLGVVPVRDAGDRRRRRRPTTRRCSRPPDTSSSVDGVRKPGQRRLEFATPGSVYADASVDVSIDTSDDGVVVELEITDHADAEVLQAFSGWPAGMPTIGEGHPVEASGHRNP